MSPLATTVPVLTMIWYILIAILWIGFFVLEGFDFGVAMLMQLRGRDDREKRVMLNTIGPLWDGNEVWLITAGGAMFAAFPGWYATLFSGLYLPLLLVLTGLILRGVSIHYRGKHDSQAFRDTFTWTAAIGSFLPTLVLGVGFANFVIGLPNDGLHWNGSFWGLFSPFALLGGVMLVVVFLVHGSAFIALKTSGAVHDRAKSFGAQLGWVAVALVAAYVIWQNVAWPATSEFGDFTMIVWALGIVTIVAMLAGVLMLTKHREGWSFSCFALAIATLFAGMLLKMYGNLGFAQDGGVEVGQRLNMITSSSSHPTLQIMSVTAAIFLPIVLAYIGWSYWVFRKRISIASIPEDVQPVA